MTQEEAETADRTESRERRVWTVPFAIAAVLIAPAAVTLLAIKEAGTLQVPSANPTPLGYTVSLSLFIFPLMALAWWFLGHPGYSFQKRSFWRTILVLAPLGFILDLLFGNAFFTFQNEGAVLGIGIPAAGGAVPVEELVFYLTGFMVVLLTYIWADEYWMRAYNVPDYGKESQAVLRLVAFHPASVIVGIVLFLAATLYKKLLSPVPEGFPWYFTFLVVVGIVPAMGFLRSTRGFINWRAFSFTCFLMLLVSVLWEATLGVPYAWWGYQREAMMGIFIGPWHDLPIEAVCVWFAVTFTTVIIYEVVKIWQASGRGLREAMLGVRSEK
jgi:hypothetical protein